ncbi:MAG TPA: SprT family zinc-dependent metalloprotease [Methylovirgula sp.]|nr:SprT family zinc-dependent metalloprotease [Methylovirgula sp.]
MPNLPRKNAPRTSQIAFLDVSHAGETYRVALKRIATARRFTLRVRTATRDVVLTMPPRASIAGARAFIERHAGWIGARLERLPPPRPFGAGEVVPIRGVNHRIVERPRQRGDVWIEPVDKGLADTRLPLLCVGADSAHVARRVKDFLIREARRDLEASVRRHAAKLGVEPRKMSLRDTTSRWGSCSSTGALNFSWRLIMAPSYVLDYLAAHEVAHLVYMNHSPAFWRVVAKLSNHVDRAEEWLKVHGAGLLRFGPFKA